VDAVTNENKFKKMVASNLFKSFKIIRENLVFVERKQPTILLDKPIQHGFSILELSRLEMFQFHFKLMKKLYDKNNIRLLYTDTDSLIYHFKTSNVYFDILPHAQEFDFSNYPSDHICAKNPYLEANHQKIGKMKDESKSQLINEFVGLRAKSYSYTHHNSSIAIKKCKGVQKSAIKHRLSHEKYLKSLKEYLTLDVKFLKIASRKHNLYTIEQSKLAISGYDDKRYILDDGINTLAYGHYKISK